MKYNIIDKVFNGHPLWNAKAVDCYLDGDYGNYLGNVEASVYDDGLGFEFEIIEFRLPNEASQLLDKGTIYSIILFGGHVDANADSVSTIVIMQEELYDSDVYAIMDSYCIPRSSYAIFNKQDGVAIINKHKNSAIFCTQVRKIIDKYDVYTEYYDELDPYLAD